MPDTPVRILPELRRLSAEELSAEVQSLRSGRARNLPVRLSLPAVRTLAHFWGMPDGEGSVLRDLSRGEEVPRHTLLADVQAVIKHCERTRDPNVPDAEDADLTHLRLLREWVETQP
jgi:hypothetical protein